MPLPRHACAARRPTRALSPTSVAGVVRALGRSGAATAVAALFAGCAPQTFPLVPPDPALLAATGPDSFTVRFTTSRGPFDVRVHRDWAPRGSDRVYYLVRSRFYDGVRFFRVVPGFVVQFGLNGDTAVGAAWRGRRIDDDAPVKSNVRGTLSFAAGGPNTRTTQIYVNYGDNSRLDRTGFAVFGQVIRGMAAVVDSIHAGYGEGPPRGQGPSQGTINREGNAYLLRDFPRLDYVITARVIEEWHR